MKLEMMDFAITYLRWVPVADTTAAIRKISNYWNLPWPEIMNEITAALETGKTMHTEFIDYRKRKTSKRGIK
jgi:hypothetical protein